MNASVKSQNLIYFLLLFLLSCSSNENKQENILYEVKILDALNKNTEVNLSDFAEGRIEYVLLDSPKEHLLAQNLHFYLNGNEIITFAKQQIYVFDRITGKFLREIGHYGKDPGGYKKVVQTFPFDEKKTTGLYRRLGFQKLLSLCCQRRFF